MEKYGIPEPNSLDSMEGLENQERDLKGKLEDRAALCLENGYVLLSKKDGERYVDDTLNFMHKFSDDSYERPLEDWSEEDRESFRKITFKLNNFASKLDTIVSGKDVRPKRLPDSFKTWHQEILSILTECGVNIDQVKELLQKIFDNNEELMSLASVGKSKTHEFLDLASIQTTTNIRFNLLLRRAVTNLINRGYLLAELGS